MAIIRLKRIATEFKSSDHKLLPGELGITGKSLLYGSMAENLDTNGKVVARQVATQNFDNSFTAENTFTAENIFKSDGKSISLQNSVGTEMYKVTAGRLIASRPTNFLFNENDLVDRKYVDNKVDGAIAASDALILKGTVNASNGIITSSDAAVNGKYLKGANNLLTNYLIGWTFKVDTEGTLTGIGTLQVGDMITAMNNYSTTFSPSHFHAFQTNVEFSTLGANIAKLSGSYGLVGSTSGGLASIVPYSTVKTNLGITWGDIGIAGAPFADKNHSHSGLNLTHNGINKDFILSIDEASGNSGAPFFSLIDGTSSVLKGQDYSDRFQFETSRVKFTFNKDLYVNTKKVLTEGDYDRASSALTGATVFSDITVVNGIVTGTKTRALTPANIGAATSGHTHSSYNRTSSALTGAIVFSDIIIANGIVTETSTRTLTASNIGAEPAITQKTAFNKDFGTGAGTVAEGNHTHDGRYYTETEIDTKLSNKKDSFSENTAFNKNFGTGLNDVSRGNHTHDDRYYTETEIDTKLSNKKDSFSENTAFNKDFGAGLDDVARGNHTHFDLVLQQTASDAGQASLSLFEELNGVTGTTTKNGIRFFSQGFGSGQYLEIARTGSRIEFNSDGPIYFNNRIEATIDGGTSW